MNWRALILIGSHLATAPRPQKEAAAARAAGFEVVVRGTWWSDSLAAEDCDLAAALGVDFAPVVDLRPGRPGRERVRLGQRIAREVFNWTGLVLPRAYGTGAPELLKEALRIQADLTMVHSEAGLWVGDQLLRRGLRVGVDFEDWFSRDMRPEDRAGRPVAAIQRLERLLLRRAHLTLTTTRAMAEEMARDAGCERVPQMIPNAFPWRDAPPTVGEPMDRRDAEAVSFYWFSQTIGPGRGLEVLAKALERVTGRWQLHLRGELRQHGEWFERTFPPAVREKVVLQATVPNRALAAHSASHDVGLALETSGIPSRDLTATNKIFEYLRCGLAVVATATRGQQEVMAACPDAGWVLPPDDEERLRECLQGLVDDRSRVARAKLMAREAGEGVWAWENFAGPLGSRLREAARGE